MPDNRRPMTLLASWAPRIRRMTDCAVEHHDRRAHRGRTSDASEVPTRRRLRHRSGRGGVVRAGPTRVRTPRRNRSRSPRRRDPTPSPAGQQHHLDSPDQTTTHCSSPLTGDTWRRLALPPLYYPGREPSEMTCACTTYGIQERSFAAATGATLAELMARLGHSTPAAAMNINTRHKAATARSRNYCPASPRPATRRSKRPFSGVPENSGGITVVASNWSSELIRCKLRTATFTRDGNFAVTARRPAVRYAPLCAG